MWVNKECCLSDQWGWKWCWRQTLDIALCWAHEGVLCWENVSSITKIPLENHKSCFCQVLRAMEMNIILFYYVKPFSNCTVQYFSLELWNGFARPHWCMIKSLSFELLLFSTIIPVSILPPIPPEENIVSPMFQLGMVPGFLMDLLRWILVTSLPP